MKGFATQQCLAAAILVLVVQQYPTSTTTCAFRPLELTSTPPRIASASSSLFATGSGGVGVGVGGDDHVVSVALTREEGKNGKLLKAIGESKHRDRIRPVELPCIEHADGPDYDRLPETLRNQRWDYVAVTSPEAARVLASAWWERDGPARPAPEALPKVAAVGTATEKALEENGIGVSFTPSTAIAKVFCKELPGGAGSRVLYPASFRARTTLQDGLAERGFEVVRLDTYDTVTATWDDGARAKASECRVASFASPSSIKGWLLNTGGDKGDDGRRDVLAACIGETSAEACRKNGWDESDIFYPDKPGIEGWVEAIEKAVEKLSAVAAH